MRSHAAVRLMAVLACAAPTPAPSAAPAQAVRAAPQTVILQAADVPGDYAIEKDEEMSPDDLANGLGTTPAELKQRLAFGYVRTRSSATSRARLRSSSPPPTACSSR